MKRVFSLVLVLLLVCALGLTAAGCKSSGGNDDEGGKYGYEIDYVPAKQAGVL